MADQPKLQPGFDAETFNAVLGLIRSLSVQVDELKTKQNEFKERLNNLLENDSQLATFMDQAKEATQAVKRRRQEILNLPEAREVTNKLKEMAEEVRDISDSLTNNLLSYYQMTGVQTFDDPDGSEREFKLNAKLMPNKKG